MRGRTKDSMEKNCRDGSERIRTDIGAGASFGEGQDPVEERHRCGPMLHWGPKRLKKKREESITVMGNKDSQNI